MGAGDDNGNNPSGLVFTPFFRNGLTLALAVLVVDQITKWWIVFTVMQPPRVIPVTPFFNLVMGWNQGISFGMLDSDFQAMAWILSLVAVAISAALGVWLYRADRLRVALSIGLVIGGAVGNVIDRVRWGAVADFLDLHWAGYHWPAFNVADSAITIGALVLILDSLFVREKKS
ncbi:MAG: signal peptidase II [Rhodospirillales bacterium]